MAALINRFNAKIESVFSHLITTITTQLPTASIWLGMVLLAMGVIGLWKGADWLVAGASHMAKCWGVSSLMIGLTIVAIGTSLPEMVVSVNAALTGSSDIALSNIVGSNISNVFLILGITALISPIKVARSTVMVDTPVAIAASLLLLLFYHLGQIGTIPAVILLVGAASYLAYTIYAGKTKAPSTNKKCPTSKSHPKLKIGWLGRDVYLIVVGLVVLIFGGTITVEGAKIIATQLGLSQVLIGLTIVAVGTSLPELVTSIICALRKETDLAVGNIVGSGILNTLLILGVAGMIAPIKINSELHFDLWINLLTFSLVLLMVRGQKKPKLTHYQGIILLSTYLLYLSMIVGRELL